MLQGNKNPEIERHPGSFKDTEARSAVSENDWVSELRAAVEGQVITPAEAGYEQTRAIFYGGFDRRPAAIVRPAGAADVSRTVSFARTTGLELAVRSGGHSTAGHSLSHGGIVLDLRPLNQLHIDPATRTAWAGSGLTAGEYTTAAGAHDLVTGFGDTASVGLGGLTLGGGVGFLVRKFGLTIDDLLEAEVVTADGQLRTVDHDHHPDLFWALRGGGGNFGVVTRFRFRLHPLPAVLGGLLVLPATPTVIAGFIEAAQAAPDELTTIANVLPAPPMPFLPAELHGRLVLLALLVYAGPPEAGQQAVAPLRSLATPLADLLRPMRYPEMYLPEEGDYHPTAVGRTLFMDRFGRAEAETLLDYLQASEAPMRVAQLRVLGGAMARVPVEATAFAHRQAPLLVNVAAFYQGEEDQPRQQAWVEQFAAALEQGDPGAYVNFLGEEGQARVRAAYPGETWQRLRAIKARYDPTNLFHLNQNIPPA